MAHILVHVHTGPDNATKAALGLAVALAVTAEGHDLSLFLAGDGVHLLSPSHADVTGLGTGRVGDHLEGLKSAGAKVFVSRMSAKARDYDDSLLEGYDATYAMPKDLVSLTAQADKALCY